MSNAQSTGILAARHFATGKLARFSIPIIAQACLSVSNLLIGVLLVRYAPAQEYGLYVLGFSCMLVLLGIQDSLVSIPVTVRSSGFTPNAKARFLEWNRRALHSVFLLIATAGILLVPLFAAHPAFVGDPRFVMIIGLAGWSWNAWDFQRAVAFAKGRSHTLVKIDGVYLCAIAAAIGVLWAAGALTAFNVLAAMGLAAAISAYTSTGFAKALEFRWSRVTQVFKCWWRRGRWSFIAAQITWVQSQAYIYLVSAMVGLEALASVASARLLFAPMATVLAAWAKTALPHIAQFAHQRDTRSVLRVLLRASLGLLAANVLWATLIVLFHGFIVAHVFGGKYVETAALIPLWAFAFCTSSLEIVWLTGLRAIGEFRKLSHVGVAGAIVTMAGTLAGIKTFGASGAVIAFAVSELVMAAIAAILLLEHSRSAARAHERLI
jgi:O-antigen/teichoic acid export membrane protein